MNPNEHCISESEFKLVEEVSATMSPLHDRLLIRTSTGIDPTYLDEAAADLRQRTSVKNPDGQYCNTVEDPRVGNVIGEGGRVYEGRWRGVSVRHELREGKGTITQTLAFGLVKTGNGLPSPELVATDDRLIRPHAVNATPEREQSEVRYRGIDPDYAEALKDTISLAGGVIDVRSVRMQDGSYNIHVLTETVTWTAFSASSPDLEFKHNEGTEHERLIQVWHGIANTDGLTGLYTAESDYNVMEVTLTENGDGSISVRRTQFHEAEATEDDRLAIEPHSISGGGVITRTIAVKQGFKAQPTPATISGAVVLFKSDLRPDGLWNSRQVNEGTAWNAFSEGSPDLSFRRHEGTEHEELVEEWHGITNTDSLTNLYTADTDYSVIEVALSDNRNGSISVRRVQHHEADATEDDRRALEPHAISGGGVVTRIVTVKQGYETQPTAATITGAVVEFVSTHRKDGLWDSRQVNETTAWNAFDETTPDLSFKRHEGTEHEQLVEEWHGIASADGLTDLYTAAADHNVVEVALSDNRNGSISVRRTQYHEADATEDDRLAINPHGINSGSFARTVTVKQGYGTQPTPAAITGAVVFFKSEHRKDGLWDSRQVNESVTWGNTTPLYDVMRVDDNGGYNKRTTYLATGIPIASAEAFISTLAATSNYIVENWWDAGNGEAHVRYVEWHTGVAVDDETARTNATGHRAATVSHTWYGVNPADIGTVYTTAKAYTGEGGDSGYIHKTARRDIHGNGFATITAMAWQPLSIGIAPTGIEWRYEEGSGLVQYRVITKRQEWTDDLSWTYKAWRYDFDHFYGPEEAQDWISGGLDGSRVDNVAHHVWRAIKVTRIVHHSTWWPGPVDTDTYGTGLVSI